jgi:hypothetical protein
MSRRTPGVFQDPTGAWRLCSPHASPPGRQTASGAASRVPLTVARSGDLAWLCCDAVLRRPGRRWLVLTAGRRGGGSRRWRGGALASVRDRGRGSWCRRRGGPCAGTRAPGRTGRVGRSGQPVRGCGATRAVPPLTARGGENASTLDRNRCWGRRSAGSVGRSSRRIAGAMRWAAPVGDAGGVWVAIQKTGSTGRA